VHYLVLTQKQKKKILRSGPINELSFHVKELQKMSLGCLENKIKNEVWFKVPDSPLLWEGIAKLLY